MADPLPFDPHIGKIDSTTGNEFGIGFMYRGHPLGIVLKLGFTPKDGSSPCHKNCNPFGPDCDPPDVDPSPKHGNQTVPDPAPPIIPGIGKPAPGSKIVFQVEQDGAPVIVGSCKIFTFRWSAWLRGPTQPLNPITGGFDGEGHFTPLAGGSVKASAGETPDGSGEFKIKVCCQKGPNGCVLTSSFVENA
jgi:hypothetical protein